MLSVNMLSKLEGAHVPTSIGLPGSAEACMSGILWVICCDSGEVLWTTHSCPYWTMELSKEFRHHLKVAFTICLQISISLWSLIG